MPFIVRCPNCAVRLHAKETMIGKSVPCPKCKTSVSIVAPVDSSEPSATHASSVPPSPVTAAVIPPILPPAAMPIPAHNGMASNTAAPEMPPAFAPQKSSMSMVTIVAIVATIGLALFMVVLVPFAVFGFLMLTSAPKPNDSANPPQPLASTTDWNSVPTSAPQPSNEQGQGNALVDAQRRADELAEQARNESANRNMAAWKEMRQCDNRYERLSRESQIEYWESMRQGYGAIDTQGVDFEFVNLLQSYRALFLTYANTHREWDLERAPLVNALNSVETPESFGEGLLVGLAGGVTIAVVEEIDKKYNSQIADLRTQLEALQTQEVALRDTMTERYGVAFP